MGELVSGRGRVRRQRRALVLRSLLSRALVGGAGLVALLVALVLGVLSAERSHAAATRSATHSAQVLNAAERAERELVDLETGVRGYAATEDRLFLQPYRFSLRALPQQLADLRRLLSDSPGQARRMAGLTRSVEGYTNDFMIPFVASPTPLRGRPLLAFMIEGKHLLDGLRAQFSVFDAVQRRLQAARDRRSARADDALVRRSVVAGVLMVLGLISFLWFVISRVVLPLRRTVDACARTADGRPGASLAIGGASELVALGTAFDRMLEQVHDRDRERQAAADELTEMFRLQEAVIGSAHHAYVAFDQRGTITGFNPAAERTFDRPRQDAIGRQVLDIIGDDQRVVWSEELHSYRETGDERFLGRTLESTGRRSDGSEFPAEVTVIVARHQGRPTFHAFISDISERVARQRDLRLMGSIVEGSEDAILTQSADGRIISWNRGAEILYGYRAEEIVGRPLAILTAPDRRGEERALLDRALGGEAITRLATERIRRDGRRLQVALTVSPLYGGDDRIIGASIIARDVTEARQMEDELRSSREQALEASRLKSEFVANMSHEIRTPLNGVVSMAELLLETPLGPDQRDYAQVALTSAEALMRVINDILDFSKIEAGKLAIVAEDFSLRGAVDEVAEITGVKAVERGLALDVDCAEEIAEVVRGDGNRVRQILMNLVSNAIKFTSEGGVAVAVTLQDDATGAAALRFEVSDTGIGIDPRRVGELFAPFSQEDATTTRCYGGTGLGLCISKQLVELMGGEIGCQSTPGQGSRFWFTLPYRPGQGLDLSGASADLTGTQVLIVEDVPSDRRRLESRLASWGITPDATGDGAGALALLHRAAEAGRPYETALLSGAVDGLALAREIRSIPALRSTRLILVGDAAVDPAQARAAGLDAQLIKPVRQSRLYNQLLSTLRKARGVDTPRTLPVQALPAALPARVPVLVAEDNEVNQFAAIRLLQSFGLRVDVARNGREAIGMTGRRRYAAVFMDCQMPEMDGFSAAAAIRRREQETGGRVLIIALTANALEGDRDRCLAAGMDDYAAKPLRLQAIEELIERLPALRTGDEVGEAVRPATPVLDGDALQEIGDRQTAAELAEMFLAQASDRVPALQAAVDAPDPGLVRRLAHGLKGSAATVGAERMSELADRLCVIATDGTIGSDAVAVAAQLARALDDTSVALSQQLLGAAA